MRSKQMTKGFSRREVLTGTGLSALAGVTLSQIPLDFQIICPYNKSCDSSLTPTKTSSM